MYQYEVRTGLLSASGARLAQIVSAAGGHLKEGIEPAGETRQGDRSPRNANTLEDCGLLFSADRREAKTAQRGTIRRSFLHCNL